MERQNADVGVTFSWYVNINIMEKVKEHAPDQPAEFYHSLGCCEASGTDISYPYTDAVG